MRELGGSLAIRRMCFSLLTILAVSSCVPRMTGLFGRGMLDASGKRQGEWVVYHRPGTVVLGAGQFIDSVPNGPWTINDTKGKKVAELVYKNGCVDGNYKLWYGHKYTATFVKTYGQAEDCELQGNFERYLPDGRLLVRYRAARGRVVSVQDGSWADAQQQLDADKELLAMYLSFLTGSD